MNRQFTGNNIHMAIKSHDITNYIIEKENVNQTLTRMAKIERTDYIKLW